MSQLQVTYSSDVFAQRVGGVSRYFAQLIRDLPDFEIVARAAAGFHNNEYLSALPRGAIRGVRLPIASPRLASHMLSRLTRATKPLWVPRTGIYHPSYYTAPVPRRRLPCVVTVYDMIHERFPEYYKRNDPTRRLKADWVRRADAIVAISDATRSDLVDVLGIPAERVTVIHPGIEPAPAADPRSHRSDNVVLYVGHRGLYKNWTTLVEAIASRELTGLRLVCFGGGAPRREELAFLERHALGGRTEFVAGSDDALSSWYRRAAVLVYPSLYEGYGYPPLEAAAHGCPVVCTNAPSLVETMADVAIFVDNPLKADEFAAAILRSLGAEVPEHSSLPTCSGAARRHADLYRSL